MSIMNALEVVAPDEHLSDGTVIGFLAIFGAIFVAGISLFIVLGHMARDDKNVARALKITSNTMNRQLKGYGNSFKSGFNSGRHRAIGALAFLVPTASAVDVETKFSDGVGQVLEGIWLIIYPYVSVAFVLFIIVVGLKKFAGRQR